MKMKRYLCLALVVVFMLAIALTGCGGDKASSDSSTAASTAAESSAAAESSTAEATATVPAETVDLTWILAGPQADPDVDMIAQKASEYLKDKLNVNLKMQVFSYGTAYDNKVNAMLSAGEAIDVVFTAGWAADYKNNAQKGFFLALDDYLKNSPIREIDGEDFLNSAKINGKIYAVNTNKEQAHQWGFLLKKDLVDKYKVDIASIKKMEDLEPVFEQIKKNEPGIYPLLPVQMDAPFKLLDWDNLSADDAPGALYPVNGKTTVVNQFTAPESIAHYKKMQEYYKKGWIPADAATLEGQVTLMTSGKYFANSQSMKPGKDAEMKISTKIDWVQLNLTPAVKTNREAGGSMLAIPAKSKNPDRAFKFIEMLYTDKTLRNMFSFGLEGVHYDKVSDNVIAMKPDNKGYASAGNGWRFGDQFKDYLVKDVDDPQKWEKFKQFNDSATALDSLGFAFNPKDVEAEVAACQSVVQNYYKQLFTGSVKDVDAEVAKMDKELKTAGVEKVLKEMQTQYDAFLAAKK
ncbi:ABC transporter substrate-binding protein [Ruminiclostridium cellobioparum]|uniref:ABC transporter substrate-binding protein n=1 Tax=Ruminiclostridium cellobioparum TaxID=29355 RepID=UPI000484EABD|nr:ABC transporter substrate-binding protein [Ruminiclostridium cellobioparum]